MIVLLLPAAFIRGRRLFEGGVYSNNYGMPKWLTEKYTSIVNSSQQTQYHIQILAVCRCLSLHECTHANSPGLSGSLPDTERISRSPVRVTKPPG